MSEEKVEIVRQLVEAFNEGGMGAEATLSFFAADAVFEEPPEQPGPTVAKDGTPLAELSCSSTRHGRSITPSPRRSA
jgi:hypothetical protein